jgi:hypothetical protein
VTGAGAALTLRVRALVQARREGREAAAAWGEMHLVKKM